MIPNELKGVDNWVCWLASPDPNSHSGIKKTPKNAKTGENAKSNDPLTWCDYYTAERESKNYSGIGFMFSNSEYFGVDLDDCKEDIEAYLNGEKNNIISKFVDTLKSYAEISQSGNGIHIICKGSLPQGGRRKGKIEMYDNGRYFIMTGNQIGEYNTISDATESIKSIHYEIFGEQKKVKQNNYIIQNIPATMDAYDVIERIRKSKNGDKFELLYNGDYSGYPSQSEADMAFCNILAFWCQRDISLMDEIYRSSGLMRDKWDRKQSGTTYGMITLHSAVASCTEVWTPNNNDDYKVIITGKEKSGDYTLDDSGNAFRMFDICGDMFRYVPTDKRWVYYENGMWREDTTMKIQQYANKVCDEMLEEQKLWKQKGEDLYAAFNKHMKKTRSHNAKNSMISEFQVLVPASPDTFDKRKDLVNTPNGIVNLNTGEIIPHDREMYMTKMLGSEISSTPTAPTLWLKFLNDIFDGDKELIRYIQKALGYSLSGSTSEQCVFFLVGSGRNGKSTFLEVVREIMGGYATNMQPETIAIKQQSGSANTDVARLKGARFVTSVEMNEGTKLNEALLKQLTGGDVITARKLYGNEFEFVPEFKLWMATNHKPVIRGTDKGIWRRIHIIPFCHTISDEEVDKDLVNKLKSELPNITAWMIDGYNLWKYEGLNIPVKVKDATKEYQHEMDAIANFVDDMCVEDGEVQASVLYDAYEEWAKDNNERIMTKRRFGTEVSKKYNKIRREYGLVYTGISVLNKNTDEFSVTIGGKSTKCNYK